MIKGMEQIVGEYVEVLEHLMIRTLEQAEHLSTKGSHMDSVSAIAVAQGYAVAAFNIQEALIRWSQQSTVDSVVHSERQDSLLDIDEPEEDIFDDLTPND